MRVFTALAIGSPELCRRPATKWLAMAALAIASGSAAPPLRADSPELAMRDFASGQIKKGVRSLGFGGDGATWGNYALVWKDADTALADYGDTSYSDGNDFHFAALGATSPSLWRDLVIYLIAMSEDSNTARFNLRDAGLGQGATPVVGHGSDTALFSKIAMPLGDGLSVGMLLAYETSHFDAQSIATPGDAVRYDTQWRPSAGFGLTWQPNRRLLFGFRALVNNDMEQRVDPAGTRDGLARSVEYRLGGSVSPWEGALIDVGGTRLEKRDSLSAMHTITYAPNIGFEQALFARHLALRLGVDETSPTVGLSAKFSPVNLDLAVVSNMARNRVGDWFGTRSNSVVATFTLDYGAWRRRPGRGLLSPWAPRNSHAKTNRTATGVRRAAHSQPNAVGTISSWGVEAV